MILTVTAGTDNSPNPAIKTVIVMLVVILLSTDRLGAAVEQLDAALCHLKIIIT